MQPIRNPLIFFARFLPDMQPSSGLQGVYKRDISQLLYTGNEAQQPACTAQHARCIAAVEPEHVSLMEDWQNLSPDLVAGAHHCRRKCRMLARMNVGTADDHVVRADHVAPDAVPEAADATATALPLGLPSRVGGLWRMMPQAFSVTTHHPAPVASLLSCKSIRSFLHILSLQQDRPSK